MRNDTRRLYAAYEAKIAEINGVERVDRKFSVQPSVQQKLETKVQESSDFLGRINVYGVTEQEGEKIGLGVSGPVASTTDTAAQDRQTSDIATLDGRSYRCEQTNSDKLACEACDLDSAKKYGKAGMGLEAHHVQPLHTLVGPKTTRLSDLALLCATCHRVLHNHKPWLTVPLLRALIQRQADA